jgi:glycerol kinase
VKYLLAVDQSTSSTKAILFDESLRLAARYNVPHRQFYPRPGWVEHDPMEIYQNLLAAVAGVFLIAKESGIEREAVQCLSISNQRETTVVWDGDTGLPVYNAVVWQCNRGEAIVRLPAIQARREDIARKTGLTLSPYFCAAKAGWVAEKMKKAKNVKNIDNAGKRLLFGTMDAWLLWKLTGRHQTDYSNASRTQLFNIHTLRWDDDLIALFGLEGMVFPEVRCSDEVFGETTLEGIFPAPIPVAGVLGDSHGAMFGQQCWEKGMGKCTFGTGNSVMMFTGDRPVFSGQGLAASIAWGMSGKVEYVLEGNINCTGDTLNWLKNELGILPDAKASEEYARQVPSTQGVYLVPAFSGLGAPHYRSDARAAICGLFRNASKYHIVRAALEAIAYQIKDVVEPMTTDAGTRFEEMRVDGGPTDNVFLMQFVADMVGARIVCNEIEELSALGAASAGGLAVGMFSDREALARLRRPGKRYEKTMDDAQARALYDGWRQALQKI